ncbi:MAG: hypothetical protein K6D59_00280 [Bacteroidales bacterium]|nr:hypothetical protein [Bacteroidales bacterium]
MKKKLLVIFACVAITLAFVSCSPVDRNINKLSKLVEMVEEDGANFTNEDWEYVSEEYREIKESLSELRDKTTNEQRQEIGRLKARLGKAVAMGKVNSITGSFGGLIDELSGFVKGMTGTDGESQHFYSEDELDDAWEDIEDAVDDIADDIEDSF